MGFNSVLEAMRKQNPGVDPMREMAKQNEAIKQLVEGRGNATPAKIKEAESDKEETGKKTADLDDVVLEDKDDGDVEMKLEMARQQVRLRQLRERNKRLETELAVKQFDLASKRAFLAEQRIDNFLSL